jgi:hypothetical protein
MVCVVECMGSRMMEKRLNSAQACPVAYVRLHVRDKLQVKVQLQVLVFYPHSA